MNITIGTIAKLKVPCMGNPIGTVGFCYEVYHLDRVGYSFIFENGEYSGFSSDEIEPFLKIVGRTDLDYNFTNVMKLSRDYDNGYFNNMFKNTKGLM